MGKIVSGYKESPYKVEYQQAKRPHKTIHAVDNVSVPASGTHRSEWIDLDGYEAIAVTFLNDAATANTGMFEWSHDGENAFIAVASMANATSKERVGTAPAYARYFRLALVNGDAAAHNMSAYVYARA
jgi:hypothetical protein